MDRDIKARPRSRQRSILGRLGLLAASTLAGLVLFETLLRWIDPVWLPRDPLAGFLAEDERIGWRGASSHRGRFTLHDFDVEIAHDARGQRTVHSPPDASPDEGAPLIWILGDSYAWGWGVASGATLADCIQATLGSRARVENLGVPGFGTGQELLLLRERLAEASPRIIVLLFYENDLRDNVDLRGGRRPVHRLDGDRLVLENSPVSRRSTGLERFLMRSTRTAPLLKQTLARMRRQGRLDDDGDRDPQSIPGEEALGPKWDIERALLAAVRTAVESEGNGCELRMAYVPRRFSVAVRTGDETNDPSLVAGAARLTALGVELGIPTLDLTLPLRAAWRADPAAGPNGEPYYFSKDPHWTGAANAVAARALLDAWEWP